MVNSPIKLSLAFCCLDGWLQFSTLGSVAPLPTMNMLWSFLFVALFFSLLSAGKFHQLPQLLHCCGPYILFSVVLQHFCEVACRFDY